MTNRSRAWCVLTALFVFVLGIPAWAVPVAIDDYIGSRTSGASGGIQGAGGWAGGNFEIAWDIQNLGGFFSYSYSITGPGGGELGKDLSHWILQVSDTFTSADLLGASGTVLGPTTYSPSDPGNSNPNLPGVIYGLKFDYGSDGSVVYSFLSTRAPMWGDFYAKDGVDAIHAGQGPPALVDVVAWNLGFGVVPVADGFGLADFGAWIAVPNTIGLVDDPVDPIPEPGTFALLALGLGGVAFLARRRVRTGGVKYPLALK